MNPTNSNQNILLYSFQFNPNSYAVTNSSAALVPYQSHPSSRSIRDQLTRRAPIGTSILHQPSFAFDNRNQQAIRSRSSDRLVLFDQRAPRARSQPSQQRFRPPSQNRVATASSRPQSRTQQANHNRGLLLNTNMSRLPLVYGPYSAGGSSASTSRTGTPFSMVQYQDHPSIQAQFQTNFATQYQPQHHTQNQDYLDQNTTSNLAMALATARQSLPSVLAPSPAPTSEQLSYTETSNFLQSLNLTSNTLLSPSPLQPRQIDICFYNPQGTMLQPIHQVTLDSTTTLPSLILKIQKSFDQALLLSTSSNPPKFSSTPELNLNLTSSFEKLSLSNQNKDTSPLIIHTLEIRYLISVKIFSSFPKFQGTPFETSQYDKGTCVSAKSIRWDISTDISEYWSTFRDILLSSDDKNIIGIDGKKIDRMSTPLVKVHTFERMGMDGGHVFLNEDAKLPSYSTSEDDDDDESEIEKGEEEEEEEEEWSEDENEDENENDKTIKQALDLKKFPENEEIYDLARRAASKFQEQGNPSDINTTEVLLAAAVLQDMKTAENLFSNPTSSSSSASSPPKNDDALKIYDRLLKSGYPPVKEIKMEYKSAKSSLKERQKDKGVNWIYYQKMGGDPRIHDVYPLDVENNCYIAGHPVWTTNLNPPKPELHLPSSSSLEEKEKGKEKENIVPEMIPYQSISPLVHAPYPPSILSTYSSEFETAREMSDSDDDIYFPDPRRLPLPNLRKTSSNHSHSTTHQESGMKNKNLNTNSGKKDEKEKTPADIARQNALLELLQMNTGEFTPAANVGSGTAYLASLANKPAGYPTTSTKMTIREFPTMSSQTLGQSQSQSQSQSQNRNLGGIGGRFTSFNQTSTSISTPNPTVSTTPISQASRPPFQTASTAVSNPYTHPTQQYRPFANLPGFQSNIQVQRQAQTNTTPTQLRASASTFTSSTSTTYSTPNLNTLLAYQSTAQGYAMGGVSRFAGQFGGMSAVNGNSMGMNGGMSGMEQQQQGVGGGGYDFTFSQGFDNSSADAGPGSGANEGNGGGNMYTFGGGGIGEVEGYESSW